MPDTVIVGEVVAGQAAKVLKQLNAAIKQEATSTFDIAELLYKVKKDHLYKEPTFAAFAASLSIKQRKAQYLERIAEVMDVCGLTRAEYEAHGVTKMRAITRLDPTVIYTNPLTSEATPMSTMIVGLVELAGEKTTDELDDAVDTLMGKVGDDAPTWLNLPFAKIVMENIIRPAIEKAKALYGDAMKKPGEEVTDISDSKAVEVIMISFTNDTSEMEAITNIKETENVE